MGVLDDSNIYCPNNGRGGGKRCTIDCDTCNDACTRISIYAREGFNDFSLSSSVNNCCGISNDECKVICGENYQYSCRISNQGNDECKGNDPKTCETYLLSTSPTQSPTQNPLKEPTTSPTNNPMSSPTESPTKSPTITPTQIPTNNPSITPSLSPSNIPTFYPTRTPTMYPTKSPTKSPTKASETNASSTMYPSVGPTSDDSQAPTASTNAPTISGVYIMSIFVPH